MISLEMVDLLSDIVLDDIDMLGGEGRLEAARAVDCAPQRFLVIGEELHRIGQNSP
jgi:hypothetical protein